MDISSLVDSSRSNSCTNISKLETDLEVAALSMRTRRKYSAEFLYHIKDKPSSKDPPACLDAQFFDDGGFWDPQKWVASFEPPYRVNSCQEAASGIETSKNTISTEDSRITKLQNEDSLDIVLSPQRRSFGGGCKVNTI